MRFDAAGRLRHRAAKDRFGAVDVALRMLAGRNRARHEHDRLRIAGMLLEHLLGANLRFLVHLRIEQQPSRLDARFGVGGIESRRDRELAIRLLRLRHRDVHVTELRVRGRRFRQLLDRVAVLDDRGVVAAPGDLLVAALDEPLRGVLGMPAA